MANKYFFEEELKMRPVKDFDEMCKEGNYIVKKKVSEGFPAVTVYDNRTSSEREYYSIYAKPIQKIVQDKKKKLYILYI